MWMHWILLGAAVLLDIGGTMALKYSKGCTLVGPTIAMGVCFTLSLVALAIAVKSIDLGVAYALWAGLGTAITVLLGIWLFKEPVSAMKMFSVLLIILGIVGLNLSAE